MNLAVESQKLMKPMLAQAAAPNSVPYLAYKTTRTWASFAAILPLVLPWATKHSIT